jgi:hypothetical protein
MKLEFKWGIIYFYFMFIYSVLLMFCNSSMIFFIETTILLTILTYMSYYYDKYDLI